MSEYLGPFSITNVLVVGCSLLVGFLCGKGLLVVANPEKKLSPREQEFKRLLTERDVMLRKLNELKDLSCLERENYFRLYSTRLVTLNQMIDSFESREVVGKCNVCLREDQTILTQEDDNGTHSVC